jgi:CRISPR-associated endonuclease/helicase Cas3
LQHAQKPQGLFSLTVPTGGGKTISSLAFALQHAKKHNLARVIYVIPYTSIIEQNAEVIAGLIGRQFVLEHHSNVLLDHDEEVNFRRKWATENWDIPVVVTTNVQFFESFFSHKPAANRKLHNIANSVIIFDEAQMLPTEYLSPSLYAISELVYNYRVTAVLCTATQPRIEKFKYQGLEVTEMVEDPYQLSKQLKRVEYQFLGQKTDEEILQKLLEAKSGLVVVNSRKHCYWLHQQLKDRGAENIFCLSTLISPLQRKEKIAKIKKMLEDQQAVYVISTQLIEAGVDIDFPVVFRSLAGVDSIIQAGGRANREGKLVDSRGQPKMGQVFVFEPKSDWGRIPPALRNFAEITKEVIGLLGEKAFSLEGIEKYFDLLYYTNAEDGLLDDKKILNEFNAGAGKYNFRNVSEKFKIIEDNSFSIIIPYSFCADEKERIKEQEYLDELINQLRNNIFNKETIRELGRYSVSVYKNERRLLQDQGVIETQEDCLILNNKNYYDQMTGLEIFTEENKNAEAFYL